jgi:hypothetical protein
MEEERARLREEISVAMDQVMEHMGTGTMVIPEPVQRGLEEGTNPQLDVDGLKALLADLQRLLP